MNDLQSRFETMFDDALTAAWTERLGWTLVHSVWQIALVAAACGVLLSILRRGSPQVRYLVGCGALLAMLAAPVGTYWWIGGGEVPSAVVEAARGTDGGAVTASSAAENVAAVVPATAERTDGGMDADARAHAGGDAAPAALSIPQSWLDGLETVVPWLSWGWLAGVVTVSVRPLVGWLTVRRLRTRGLSPLASELQELGERLAARLSIARPVAFARSALVEVPSVVGYLRPLVLVPASAVTGLSAEQLQSILVHELAHVRRHDYLVNLFQTLVEGLLFYHPGAWWVSSRVRQERENCCDDVAVQFAASRTDYVRALALLEERRIGTSLVLAASGGSLARRARRLLGAPAEPPRRHTSAACVAGLLALAMAASLVVAGQVAAEQRPQREDRKQREQIDRERPARATRVVLSHVDDTAEGMRSIAASGHAVRFERGEEAAFVDAIEIFASRYGTPQPPRDDFHVYLLNEEFQVLKEMEYGYRLIPRGDLKWHRLRMPAVEVPEVFYVALAFNPHRTKGIYMGLDESVAETHSLTGLVEDGFEKWEAASDWMVRVHMTDRPTGRGIQRLADWKPPADAEDPFAGAIEVRFDDDKSAGKQSYGGAGPVLTVPIAKFVPPGTDLEDVRLVGLRVYGSRYGSGYDPETTMLHASVLNEKAEAVSRQEVPYGAFGYDERWVDMVFEEPVAIAESLSGDGVLTLGIDPQAERTKGIYFHYSEGAGEGNSKGFVPGERFFNVQDRRWMIRAYLAVEE